MSGRPGDGPVCRLILIGFMGSGKSTVGRRIAALLGWDFVDFDDAIERRTGRSVPEIFRRDGEAAFRSLEAELTEELAHRTHVVLAPGGGWITQPELLELFGGDTLVVWLRVSPAEAVRRAEHDEARRPLLAGPDPLHTARRLMRQREPLYRMADMVVDVDALSPDEIAASVVDRIDEFEIG